MGILPHVTFARPASRIALSDCVLNSTTDLRPKIKNCHPLSLTITIIPITLRRLLKQTGRTADHSTYAYEQTVAPTHEVAAEPAPEDVQVHAHAVQEHIAPEPTSWPDRSASPHMTDENGYEWVTMADGTNYYRISGSMDEWSKFDA